MRKIVENLITFLSQMVLDLGQEVCTKISVMKYKLWLSIRATMVPYQCHGKINLTYSYMGLNHGTLLIFTIQIKNSILFELFSLGKNQIIWDWFFVSFQLKNNSYRMFFPIYWTFLGILMWIWHLYMFYTQVYLDLPIYWGSIWHKGLFGRNSLTVRTV